MDEIFINKIFRDCLTKYASEHDGRVGLAKQDIIDEVLRCNGNYNDVRAVMQKGVELLVPKKDRSRFI